MTELILRLESSIRSGWSRWEMIPVLYRNVHVFLLPDPPFRHCSFVNPMVILFSAIPVVLVRIRPKAYTALPVDKEPRALSVLLAAPMLCTPLLLEEPVLIKKPAFALLP